MAVRSYKPTSPGRRRMSVSDFEAITSGDQPVLKAVVGLTAVVFVLIQTATELLYRLLDPRVAR